MASFCDVYHDIWTRLCQEEGQPDYDKPDFSNIFKNHETSSDVLSRVLDCAKQCESYECISRNKEDFYNKTSKIDTTVEDCLNCKEKGTKLFKEASFDKAIDHYNQYLFLCYSLEKSAQ